MDLFSNPKGGYRFLRGTEPYCSAVIAEPGWEIVHVTLARPLPWHAGLVAVRRFLEGAGRERHSLCGVELRCPRPFTLEGFIAFNQGYRAVLEEWDMLLGAENPVARTNVAPVAAAPSESVLYGFSYTEPSDTTRPTFVTAGAGEIRKGGLDESHIVRLGESGDDAMIAKARRVVEIMNERLTGLGVKNEHLSTIDVYTAHGLRGPLAEIVVPGLPAAAHIGVRWFHSRPPVVDIEFEMDMRGVRRDLVIDLEYERAR